MSLFGFKSPKEVEEEKRKAIEQSKSENLENLSNIGKGSTIQFAIPYFDVFDPRLTDYGVPMAVHGSLVYCIDDIELFSRLNRNEDYNDYTFRDKVKGNVTKLIKSFVCNIPNEAQIPAIQIERKILEISDLAQQYIAPQIAKIYGITVRDVSITEIIIDKSSRGYQELKVLTADLERDNVLAKHNADLSNYNLQNQLYQDELKTQTSLNLDSMKRKQEMELYGQEETQRMNLENQKDTMRIKREEMQRASRLGLETKFFNAHQANLNAGVDSTKNRSHSIFGSLSSGTLSIAPTMPGANSRPPQTQYMIGINGQQAGPFGWEQLKQLIQQGQLTQQTFVWTQGMENWEHAGNVNELRSLFTATPPVLPRF